MSSRPARQVLARICVAAAALFAVLGALSLDVFTVRKDQLAAILFPAGVASDDAFRAIVAVGGLPVRETRLRLWSGVVWIAAPTSPDFLERVKLRGASAVINPLALGGCLLSGSQ